MREILNLGRHWHGWLRAPVCVYALSLFWVTASCAAAGEASAGAAIASGLDLPGDPDDPGWAHLLVEAARQAAWDRTDVLHEGAAGHALVAESRL